MVESGTRQKKLLLITSGCSAAGVGEVWNAFQLVSRLSRRHDVTLLTFRKRGGPPTAPQLPGARVVEWDEPPFVGRWERFNAMLKPGYVSFYFQARRWIKRRLRTGERFDLAHQITPLALRYPSPAAGLGLPLVIGPAGGSLADPAGFEVEADEAPWFTRLRAIDRWRLRRDPLLRRTFSSASCVICIAPYVRELLRCVPVRHFEVMSDVGVSELPPAKCLARPNGRGLKLLFVGRVIRTKGVRDAIRAVAKLTDLEGLLFDVVGDGYDLPACKQEARKLGVGNLVTFHGRLARKDVDAFYAGADVFLFPSFREPGGIAVIEAMSHGLAMIVADRGGPGYVVDDACGVRVPVTDPEQFASDLALAVRKLVAAPQLIVPMGEAGRAKVCRELLWDAKVGRIEQIYNRVPTVE
jgi:glycosyltransferase involved in cell wall biosynthesis